MRLLNTGTNGVVTMFEPSSWIDALGGFSSFARFSTPPVFWADADATMPTKASATINLNMNRAPPAQPLSSSLVAYTEDSKVAFASGPCFAGLTPRITHDRFQSDASLDYAPCRELRHIIGVQPQRLPEYLGVVLPEQRRRPAVYCRTVRHAPKP